MQKLNSPYNVDAKALTNSMNITKTDLECHTRAMLREISKHYNIPIKDLINVLFKTQQEEEEAKNIELEYFTYNDREYLFDADSRYVYSFNNPNVIVGQLNDNNEIMFKIA